MPIITSKLSLFNRGVERATKFCKANGVKVPEFKSEEDWHFDVCAYYRPETIYIYLPNCQVCCREAPSRNWTWPGSTTDREPFGVICHELGHHCDWTQGDQKGRYYSNYSISIRKLSGESPLTSYCPNDAEWFAEMFRLFVSNHALLKAIKPKTHKLLIADWKPASHDDWTVELGGNVPKRVLANLVKKAVF